MDKWNRKLIVAITVITAYLLLGTVFFHFAEGWRVVDSFYFTGITLSTVGYGDFNPSHDYTKIASVFFAFTGIGIVFYSISIIGQRYFEREEERLQKIWEAAKGMGENHKEKKRFRAVLRRKVTKASVDQTVPQESSNEQDR